MTDEQLDEMFIDIRDDFENQFIKHYFDKGYKVYSELTAEDKHEMACFGAYVIAEWVINNIKGD